MPLVRYLWNGPAGLPPALAAEWRLVAIRWLGIVLVIPSLGRLGLPPDRLIAAYVVLVVAALFNLSVQRALPHHPRVLASGYLTTIGDAALTLVMVTLGGGFTSPLYVVLYTVTISSAMRYGYGPTAAITLMYSSFDLAERLRLDGVDGPFLIRSGFLVLTGLLASYLREQARQAEDALQVQLRHATHDALHDSLTGLPNRQLLVQQLERMLAESRRTGTSLALLFINVDRVKEVNETFGHRYGDVLLAKTGRRLSGIVPRDGALARVSGSKFALVMPSTDAESAGLAASSLVRKIEQPLQVEEITVDVTAFVGIVVAPDHGNEPDMLLRQAEVAMHNARTHRGARAVYSSDQDHHMRDRIELAADLKRAVERRELYLQYQPVVSMSTGQIDEVEALVRWQHPTRGFVSPGEFIPLAEETGAIVDIGRWVLEEACSQAAAWRTQFASARSLVMNVNVSARQFQHADVVTDIRQVLADCGLEADGLKVEITETVAMADPELSIASLWNLKGMGVRLAIDDFGTGYSSLGYLKRFPADTLKIDKVFIDGLGIHPEDSAIVAATIAFARAVGLTTTAEGVETRDQLALLEELGADRVQGYYFWKPLRAEQIAELLSNAEAPRQLTANGTQQDTDKHLRAA